MKDLGIKDVGRNKDVKTGDTIETTSCGQIKPGTILTVQDVMQERNGTVRVLAGGVWHYPCDYEVKPQPEVMLQYSEFKYIATFVIWCDTEIARFGFACKGYKPTSLPYGSQTLAEKAARKLIKSYPAGSQVDASVLHS